MMTYDEIKDEYPLGCEVRLQMRKAPRGGGVAMGADWTPQGKLLAILDPSKHGPKCLLFKIESPKGRKISRESARATLMRKAGKGFNGPPHPDHKGKLGIRRTETEEIDLDALAMPADKKGVLKWLTPSEVKERVDKEEQSQKFKEWIDKYSEPSEALKPKEPMDRTEQLKKMLKPGMKVKLSEKKWFGQWTTFKRITRGEQGCFTDEGGWIWPLTMIDKVEEEARYCDKLPEFGDRIKDKKDLGGVLVQINDHEPKYKCKMDNGRYHTIPSERIRREGPFEHPQGPPRLEDRYPTKDPDTIPVPRERVKEELRPWLLVHPDHSYYAKQSLRGVFGQQLIIDLLQEIEEEEKYVDGLNVKTQFDDEPDMETEHIIGGNNSAGTSRLKWAAKVNSDHIRCADDLVPEIHKEGDNYIVKFKKA